MGGALELIRRHQVSVVGFQEMQGSQRAAFRRGAPGWQLFPGDSLGNSGENSIGWDTNNVEPDLTSRKVTRLAFRQSASGDFSKAYGRHRGGIHAITADGNLRVLGSGDVFLSRQGGEINNRWAVPAFIGR